MTKTSKPELDLHCFEHLKIRILDLPFDLAQGGESFDSAQDRELVERLVEPFRASDLGFHQHSPRS